VIVGEQQQSNVVGSTPIVVQRTCFGDVIYVGAPIVEHNEGMVCG
jgi:hypothetical protein